MAKFIFEVPLRPEPMDFSIVIRDRTYRFQTQYREEDEAGWLLDIADGDKGNPLVFGIPLTTGLDLLWQYKHLDFGFHLILKCFDDRQTPTFESLGVEDKVLVVLSSDPTERVFDAPPLYPIDLDIYPPGYL